MRFIEDKEIDLRDSQDQFDSLHYSHTLVDVIKHAPTEPFAIGIFGQWGSGKSSIVRTAQEILRADKATKYHFFTYDAWKYSKDSFRRTFLINLARSLGLPEGDEFQSFYVTKSETVPIKREINVSVAIPIVLVVAVIYLALSGAGESKLSWTLQTILMAIAVALSFFTHISRDYVRSVQKPILFSPEQFEDCFNDILSRVMNKTSLPKRFVEWFKGDGRLQNVDRLVIVLDNIDRCEHKIAYELLSDLKNFLGRQNVVFVIPVDDDALRTHVASVNKSDDREADEFLRKIFNNTIKIKPFKTQDLYVYTENLSKNYGLGLQPNTIDVIAKEYATNPRRIIQFLNSLISEKDYIARRKDSDFAIKHETVIALLLILREEWPAFYRKIADAPFKLKNLDQAIELAGEQLPKAQIFLRKTHPHVSSIDDKVLTVIITNREQHPHVSEILINALASRDEKSIREFTETAQEGARYLADYLINELEKATGRDVVASLASAFNELIFLNSITPLTEHVNKRVQGILSNGQTLDKCFENIDDASRWGKYVSTLEQQGLTAFQKRLIGYLNKLAEADDNKLEASSPGLFAKHWSAIVKAMAEHSNDINTLKSLKKQFAIVFRDEDFKLQEFGLSQKQVQALSSEHLLQLVIHRFDPQKPETHQQWVYLIQNSNVPTSAIETWIEKFLANHGDFGGFTKETALPRIALMRETLSVCRSKVRADLLQQFLDRIFSNRMINISGRPQQKTSLIAEIGNNSSELAQVIDLACAIYIATNGQANSAQRLIEIASRGEEIADMVISKLNLLHESQNFPLIPLHDFLVAQTRLRPELLTIYKWLVVDKKHDKKSEYLLDDNNAHTILAKCVNALVDGTEVSTLEQYFQEWVKDQRIRKLLAKIVSAMEKDKILKLPKSVQETAYSHICQGDNIFEYGNEVEFIGAMNEQDNTTFNKQIERVIVDKLIKEESFSEGLRLLETISSFKGMKKANLRSYLDEKSQDTEVGERISKLLKKLS